MPHCDACNCDCDNLSALDTFNLRCERLMRSHPIAIDGARLPYIAESEQYQFGFRPFLPSAADMRLVGMFLTATALRPKPQPPSAGAGVWGRDIYDIGVRGWRAGHRYFAVLIANTVGEAPQPFEYNKGDEFDISRTSFSIEVLEDVVAEWPDDLVVNWLDRSRLYLREFVYRSVGSSTA